MLDNDFLKFWGNPIHVYTDQDAIEDGSLIDVSESQAYFNGKLINRATCGAAELLDLHELETDIIKNRLEFIVGNCSKDREDGDAWGIFKPHAHLGNERLWLVTNELGGYTLMLPEEY